jgi:trk system potassium uptake protein TrkH
MNRLLICRLLGFISLLIGASMSLSLPWALPAFGEVEHFEGRSFWALLGAMAVCGVVGGLLMYLGREAKGERLYRKEAMAVVGLSWLLATILGAIPFWLSGTCWDVDPSGNPLRMGLVDGLFESASGFTCTGATVLTDLEVPDPLHPGSEALHPKDPRRQGRALVPRAILFWRSETHFLGGLGIMVLFVAILGLGSAGKALMLTEMPGPSQPSDHARSQWAAGVFALIFLGLNALLVLLLLVEGVSLFDALCHAFGTVATGGFSTYNASVGHFESVGIEMTVTVFMFLGCTNFTLLYYLVLLRPRKLLGDVEFRVYALVLLGATVLVIAFGLSAGDFDAPQGAVRYGLFQVTSMMTNTGFATHDFDRWNGFSKAVLLILMYVGGCAGSTSCAVKVIRIVLLVKILALEIERAFRPSVVRHVRLGGKPVEDPRLRNEIPIYVGMILVISLLAWVALVAIEPDQSWSSRGLSPRDKLTDCGSAVAATINGVGPGLGVVGATANYAGLQPASKFIITWLMLLGRLEVFVILVLFMPRFWRSQ